MRFPKDMFAVFGLLALMGGMALGQISSAHLTNLTPGPLTSPTVSPTVSPTGTASPLAGLATTLEVAEALNFLHHVNSLEVQEASEAQARLTSPQAQNVAQTLITDHQQSEQEVTQLAAQKGVTLVVFQPATYEQASSALLRTLSGPSFDAAYLQIQTSGHEMALAELQRLQGQVTDPQVKSLINSQIPVIQRHIQLARAAEANVGSPAVRPTVSPTVSPISMSH